MSLQMQPPRIHHPPPPLSNPHPSLTHVPSEDEDEDEDQVAMGDQPQQRTVRKRSSKACDNCRKAKCKCEKSADSTACRNCVLLGQECTFLGPSRKRGPPKGYIDAIEARLHQLEALLGTLIASPDPRAQSLIADLITDPLARHIIARVDESPFGSRGKDSSDGRDPKARTHINTARTAILNGQVGFDVPPRDWQDELGARIMHSSHQPSSRHVPTPPARSPPDAQRRRLSSSGSVSPAQPRHTHLPPDESDGEPDPIIDALGQLSLNEHHQLRYHGKASGLHILAQAPAYRRDRVRMDDDGIWKFPASRVWPPVAEERDSDSEGRLDTIAGPSESYEALEQRVAASVLPSRGQQEKLLKLYFAYVHPVLPVVHQEVFWRDWEASADPSAPASSRIPTLLLLAIYAVAARYDASRRPPRAGTMWAAGDNYLEAAKVLLNRSYASSKASTCQALLLLSYREIGIGAMAQAWLYVGMSVRMAQDLGLHRSIDKWQAAGAKTFSAAEKQTRRCIWFGCVVMDKYVSTYIGRPLAVFERDYDTRWPDQDASEEHDQDWVDIAKDEAKGAYEPVPGRVLPCFAAASKLSAILSKIVEALYSIRPAPGASKSAERAQLEEELEKWLLNLPVDLRYDITRGVIEGSGKVPPPHVLTLHMMYWCSLLLLHRPSIRFNKSPPPTHRYASPEGSTTSDQSTSTSSTRAIGLCRFAANHITKIVSTYGEHFSLARGPAFLSYYVFSASIMHVTLLMMNPEDVQAQMGLQECMTALEAMNTTWPSAGRAFELLNESKMNIQEHHQYLESLRHSPWRPKRKTPEEQEDGTEQERQRSSSRDGIQLAPMRDVRPIVNLRTQPRDNGIIGHTSPTHPPPNSHSPAPPMIHHSRPSIRHMQPSSGQPQNYPPMTSTSSYPTPQSAQPVEPLFADPAYGRWGNDLPSYNHPTDGGQAYFGNAGNSWDGHLQSSQHPQQQPPAPAPQSWSTSATRFSAERPTPSSSAGNPNGYWQDYQPPTFGNDMSSSLYGIMPQVPGAVGMQSIFQDGATGVYQNPDGQGGISPSYSVYSRLS
ncbi:Lactose regulatory protein LAC9 [Kluyveromyces lactis NRRL Y-1140] [Rhizoctonia solani]|uniref:Lactose regulatory protein LAC9 [Kluyveromyces lactis NRRL Y-1140] n=1 Tax=Rhizoctonia solani TaxID=456999 RepID=A0A0K6FQA0_9AGAM|nr:Lactose regulatory protein LAC9 [Kluyveromyces lactis NRRL Y-1140] [Rhizoctonia solani]